MDADLALTLGAAGLVLALPAALAALADGRRPWAAGVLALTGGGLIVWAAQVRGAWPGPADLGAAMLAVLARVL